MFQVRTKLQSAREVMRFASSIIHEPSPGKKAVCSVSPNAVMALASPRRVVAGLGPSRCVAHLFRLHRRSRLRRSRPRLHRRRPRNAESPRLTVVVPLHVKVYIGARGSEFGAKYLTAAAILLRQTHRSAAGQPLEKRSGLR